LIACATLLAATRVSPAAQTPEAVTLTLRLADGQRQFRPGEIIPIELTFTSGVWERFFVDGAIYDRSGRLTIDEFRISPIERVTDPLLDYFAASNGFIGGGLRGTGQLGEQPYTVKLELNEWFRFDTPGIITLSVRSNRVTDESMRKPGSNPVVPVVSNAITFEILPRDRRWEDAELERARQMLIAKQPGNSRDGCRVLRFLATNGAVDDMVRQYDGECEFDFTMGLFSAPDRAHVIQQLESGLSAPDQTVTARYLRTLSVLSAYHRQPELRPAQTPEAKGRLIAGGELARRPEIVEAESEHYSRLLEAALPLKTDPTARAVSTAERAAIVAAKPAATTTAAGAARRQLIASFADLPASRQQPLLMFQWRTVADASLVSALRQLATGAGPLADLAMRRLYQLAPVEGRARILETITRPHPGSTLQTLGMLPDATLPDLDEIIVRNVETAGNFGTSDIAVALLHRYASPAVAPRMLESISRSVGRLACARQAYALAYLLRAVPQRGVELLDQAMAARSPTNCYQTVLRDTAQHRMTPELERRAIAALDDEHPRVVLSAIDTLGRFGSAASAAPLRAYFAAWNRTWLGRADELQFNPTMRADDPRIVNQSIETAYLRALAAPLGWLTSDAEIAALRDWCVTEGCRRNAASLMQQAGEATTIHISTFDSDTEFAARVAQYSLDSIGALAKKLAQYPKGTTFTVRASGDPETARAITADLTAWAARQRLSIRP
jgi:hypothetical protein